MAEPGVTVEPIPEDDNSEKKLSPDAFQNFLQGKRHMLVHDYSNAVSSLADACQLYAEHFGETAFECGEVYFHYGKALFRLFQQQAGIIANTGSDESSTDEDPKNSDSEEDKEKETTENADTISNEEDDKAEVEENEKGEEEGDEKEEKEEEEDDDEEDIEEDDKAEVEENEKGEEEGDEKEEEEDDDEEDIEEDDTNEADPDSTTATTSQGQSTSLIPAEGNEAKSKEPVTEPAVNSSEKDVKTESSDGKPPGDEADMIVEGSDLDQAGPSGSRPKTEEEISDLQLAWETLETAKAVFTKHSDSSEDNRLKVAEILLILAEISMELENYSAAVDDLNECLLIRQKYLPADDRLIAEIYYQLGLVYTLGSQVDFALSNYQKSIDCIMLRIENLKNETGILKTPEGYNLLPAEEIKELEALLPEIKGKIEDTQGMVEDTKKLLQKELSLQAAEIVSDKPATNITHLLKRKKPEDQSVASTSECKKIKLTLSPNGQEKVTKEAEPSSVTSESSSNV